MSIPTQLELNNWKLFKSQSINLNLHPVGNTRGLILLGANGSGKTSILEAYYSLLTSKAWPGTKFNQSLHFGSNYFGIRSLDNQWFFNGQVSPRGRVITKWEKPENLIERPAIFWYQPNFNYWLGLSRGDKLKILDMLIMMSGNTKYNQALAKLNQLIKGKQNLINQEDSNVIDKITLNQLNEGIFENSTIVWQGRKDFFEAIATSINTFGKLIETDMSGFGMRLEYSNIMGRRNIIDTDLPIRPTDTQWENICNKEVLVGQVLYGAHRDNFEFEINRQQLSSILSRGEMRLFTFWIIQLAITQLRSKNPDQKIMLLADDIFNELDTTRNLLLFDLIISSVDYFLITSAQSIEGLEDCSSQIVELY